MNAAVSMSIGVLAHRTGCTAPTIRYYEEIGLLPAGPRTEAGRRLYGEATVRRLTFVRRCRDFGFSIEQVRELVGFVDEPGRPCMEVRDVAAGHLRQLRERLAELRALEASMACFVERCDTACAGGAAIDCTILEDLCDAGRANGAPARTGCCEGAASCHDTPHGRDPDDPPDFRSVGSPR